MLGQGSRSRVKAFNWHPILSRVIDMIRQTFFTQDYGGKQRKAIVALLKLIIHNFFRENMLHSPPIQGLQNKKFELDAQIYLYWDLN